MINFLPALSPLNRLDEKINYEGGPFSIRSFPDFSQDHILEAPQDDDNALLVSFSMSVRGGRRSFMSWAALTFCLSKMTLTCKNNKKGFFLEILTMQFG